MPPATPSDDAPPEERAPARRLSWTRLGLLLVVVGALTAAAVVRVDGTGSEEEPATTSWSVPYVDVTLTPTFQFQDPAANPARTVALGFVVADAGEACTPSWGTYYTLDGAGQDLDLDRRITQLRSAGGDVVVSFGGQSNTELAVACTDADALAAAYRGVVDRYDLATIDLDVEGTAVADTAATARRAEALAALQAERATDGTPLAVWLTLPVTPAGLPADAVQLVTDTLAAGVDLAGVNVMTMDYGDALGSGVGMLEAAQDALTATAGQLADVYAGQGTRLTDTEVWAKLGATPMIGQNDVEGEVFTLDDAAGLATFAREHRLGRLSLWSINRDQPCSASFADVAVHSDTCSGVAQEPLAFTTALGRAGSSATGTSAVTEVVRDDGRAPVVDDPATSPYPIWRAEGSYPAGYKVVWHGDVYEAQWYVTGTDPSTGASTTPFPWALVGPVTTSEAAPDPVPTVSDVTGQWDPDVLYTKGQRVLFDGLPYEARWANQSTPPGVLFPISPDEAWAPLFSIPGEPTGS